MYNIPTMIIGLTGKNASGKGIAADFFTRNGCTYISLSDFLRDELKKQRKKITRDNLIVIGREIREKYGPGYLAQRAVDSFEAGQNYVVDSIRSPFEVEVLQKAKNFSLIATEAKPKIRFTRIHERNRESDPKTYEEFIALEKEEAVSKDKSGQDLDATIKKADKKIANNNSIEKFEKKLTDFFVKKNKKIKRPSWDNYFIDIAKVVAMRGNCMKRKVGAVIVKDRRIISTGYNGSPRGIKNCSEGGCERCSSLTASGKNLDQCICSHAEENAITQAAYHGASVKNACIYVTCSPCLTCTKMIINSGIKEVIYLGNYPDPLARKILKGSHVKAKKI
ncbi:deaminase [Candidatus Margulisiibacteriota bacterium]